MTTPSGQSAPATPAGEVQRGSRAPRSPEEPLNKAVILRWSLWSWGNATVSALMVTFVFGTYIADAVGPGGQGSQYLTTANLVAGLIIALTAPVIGQRADKAGRRQLWLTINTVLVVLLCAACFFVKPDTGFLLLGVTLMAAMTLFDEFANLNYNAMITDISDHSRMGRVSGIGWGSGYLGGIVILAIAYFGLVADGGLLGVSTDEAFNIRLVAVVGAVWFLIWALPLLFTRMTTADEMAAAERIPVSESYRRLVRVVVGLWREDRNTFWFLVASAVYRDGLSAIFTYGAILGVTIYGFTSGDILLFGIAGNVVAALGAISGGFFDDRIGPRRVIVFSVAALMLIAAVMYFFDVEREVLGLTVTPTAAFWVLGLTLCLFVGPAQASSRAFVGRLAPPERAAELFGLYATAGRSIGFLTSGVSALLLTITLGAEADIEDAEKALIIGILVVLACGLALLLKVKDPTGPAKMAEH
ncbi:MFS transporter [Nesterenkonia sp.]|uniref:MFS transporter n=1 Tax=Nesterenkonia sp. TaxID=704201 RepID=UPI002638D5EE|nr:MFS transporter [Nesterenkonia sp.]